MKKIGFAIIVTLALSGCGGKGKTTCSPLVFTTSSTTVKCDKIRFTRKDLPEDQLMFMASGYSSISEEASKGQGEYLDSLSVLLSCENKRQLAKELKSQYSTIFVHGSDPASSLLKIHSLVRNTPSLNRSCYLYGKSVLRMNPGFLEMAYFLNRH